MKTNKPHILLLLALTAVFTCCSGDDYSDINTSGSPDGGSSTAPFTITVTDGGYASLSGGSSTRASEANYKTIFTEGDQIGVFAVKDGEIVDEVNNLHLCYTDNDPTDLITLAWIDASGNPPANIKGATYYAYYPYQENLNIKQLNPKAATAAGFFAGVISNWSPKSNQSTYANYTAQDLMIAQGKADFTNKTLSFSMQHQMALAVIDLPRFEYTLSTDRNYTWKVDAPDTKFSNFKPCRMEDGTYRYLMNPSKTQDALFSGSYTSAYGLTTWKAQTHTIDAGKYQIIEVDGGCRKVDHELAVGDFFMKDGSLIAGSTQSLTPEQQAACIGIVFWVGDATQKDQTLNADHPSCTHGLVVALNDVAGRTATWQNSYSSVQSWLNEHHSREYLSVVSRLGVNDPLNNIQGYNNTKAIEEFNKFAASENLVQAVSTVADYRKEAPAPANSSNWYLPSEKELTLLCGKDVVNIWGNNFIGTANWSLINGKLSSISSVATRIGSNGYWSSTEYSSGRAFYLRFYDTYVDDTPKDLSNYRVRGVLAF